MCWTRALLHEASEAFLPIDLLETRFAHVEAKRAYDPDNPAKAAFATFALPQIRGAVVEAISASRGVSRGTYRAAKRNAARARTEGALPHEVQTEQWIAHSVEAGGPRPNPEPFTDIEWGLKRDELLAAIERIPWVREREIVRMVCLQGLSQSVAGERFGIQQAATSKALKSGLETLRELLAIGSALDSAQLPSTLEKPNDLRQRRAVRLLYGERLDPADAGRSLHLSSVEFRSLHRTALGTIKSVLLD